MKTMKSVLVAVLVCVALSFSNAEDDGQYRPEKYGSDDGSYRRNNEGLYFGVRDNTYKVYTAFDNSYKSLLERNGKYNPIYSTVQPVYVKAYNPYQQLLTPYVNYGAESSFDQDPFGTSLAGVTYRPPVVPVVSTVNPVVYASTPKPVVYAASTVNPVLYAASTPKPFVYTASTPKPIVYASSANVPIPIYAKSANVPIPVYAKNYQTEQYARIVKQDQDVDTNAYRYSYETENGINAGETGVVDPSVNGGGTRASGFYEYIGDDGLKYRVDYTADENGFHPSGAHLP